MLAPTLRVNVFAGSAQMGTNGGSCYCHAVEGWPMLAPRNRVHCFPSRKFPGTLGHWCLRIEKVLQVSCASLGGACFQRGKCGKSPARSAICLVPDMESGRVSARQPLGFAGLLAVLLASGASGSFGARLHVSRYVLLGPFRAQMCCYVPWPS